MVVACNKCKHWLKYQDGYVGQCTHLGIYYSKGGENIGVGKAQEDREPLYTDCDFGCINFNSDEITLASFRTR